VANFPQGCVIFRVMKRLFLPFYLLVAVLAGLASCRHEDTGEKMHAQPVYGASYHQTALKAIGQTIEQYPANPDGYYQKARILEAMGNSNNAILNLKRAVKLDSSNALYHKELARLFLITGKHRRAEESIQLAWQLGDRTASAYTIMAQVNAQQGYYPQAMNYLNKALEAEPHNGQLIFEKGRLYMMQGDTARAKTYLESNQPLLANQPELYTVLASIYRSEKNYRQALGYMKQSMALQPDNEELPLQAVALLLDARMPDSARVVLQQMQRQRGEKADIALMIARLHLDQNRSDSAEYYFNRTLALDSRSKEAYFWLGKMYDRKRQYYTAREQYRNALLLDTTFTEARQALVTVDRTLENIARWKARQAEINSLPEANTVKPKTVEQ
jgi:tetratricopeptide (TPR) repeat protein